MKHITRQRIFLCFLTVLLIILSCAACDVKQHGSTSGTEAEPSAPDISRFLVAVEDEPDTVDFQCTSIHYTVAQNVFNRLVEMENDENGEMQILPSLAESWELSDDGRTYTFHLRKDVAFSNGSPLTASDFGLSFGSSFGSCLPDAA